MANSKNPFECGSGDRGAVVGSRAGAKTNGRAGEGDVPSGARDWDEFEAGKIRR